MNKIKITRAGGYDPKLGPKHPDNQDPTLVKSTFQDGDLQRTIKIEADAGRVVVKEVDSDETHVSVESDTGTGHMVWTSVRLDSDQLWRLAAGITSLYGGLAVCSDEIRMKTDALRTKIIDVLERNESRCLDDDIDRGVVVSELLNALALGAP